MNEERARGAGQPAATSHTVLAAGIEGTPYGPPVWAVAFPTGRGVVVSVGSSALALPWAAWDEVCAAVAVVRSKLPAALA
jgi:hypothetical protein